jgi:hypothetical protein
VAGTAVTKKSAASGQEHPQERRKAGTPDRSPVAPLVATGPLETAETVPLVPAEGIPSGPSAPLAEIIQAWPRLPQPVQAAITTIIHTALGDPAR